MPKRLPTNERGHGRYAAGLFAATVVLTGGVGTCLMIAFVFAPDLWRPTIIIGGGLLATVAVMRLLMDRPGRRSQNTGFYLAEREGLDEYLQSFRPRHRQRRDRTLGNNPPPTIEGVRQIKEDSNAWHPSDRRAHEYRQTLQDFGT